MNNSHEIYCLFVYLFLTKLKPETEGSVKEEGNEDFQLLFGYAASDEDVLLEMKKNKKLP